MKYSDESPKEPAPLPYSVRVVEHCWIQMSDGIRLSARLWIPEGAEDHPIPAILEYIPYRKRDLKRDRDEPIHAWLAGHGYACARVDIRGSGDSEGVLLDEYLPSELDDGISVIQWLSEQSWCDGSIGMMGISWGGFNALQIAALRPPELKAVIAVAATDDRFADDVHHMGGCLLGDNLSWAGNMFAFNSLPPDPEIVGDQWRGMWFERLEGSGLWLEKWLRHQRRDAYWRHGSICEDYDAIDCPVMIVSGWSDGYTNAVFRMVEHLSSPCKGLVGPWSHLYPHLGRPGPPIGFLQECRRWWDQWLKGDDRAIEEEPDLRVYMLDSIPPTTSYEIRPGRWVAEKTWPSPRIEESTWVCDGLKLVSDTGEVAPESLTIESPLTVGLFAGKWCSYAGGPDLPHDQREEDGGALVFETDPLDRQIEILGSPIFQGSVASSERIAMIAVRLSDVAPDGKATRVTYGLLNLSHRKSNQYPEDMTPGKPEDVTVKLNYIAQSFPKGHKIRLSISSSYWPLAWPPPQNTSLTIRTGKSRLTLPIRPQRDEDEHLRPFEEPEMAEGPTRRLIEPEKHNWLVKRDLASDTSTLEVLDHRGRYYIEDINLIVDRKTWEYYRSTGNDFQSPEGETVSHFSLEREAWKIHTRTRTRLFADETSFFLHAELDAYEDSVRVFSKNWSVVIPRDHV